MASKTYKNVLEKSRIGLRKYRQRRALISMRNRTLKRIVIGSSGTHFDGWLSTDKEILNLLDKKAWSEFFEQNQLDAILAEHVWEHLQPSEAIIAAVTCYTFLKPGGYLRVAVPDGFNPDQSYIRSVKPGGTGAGASDHKVLYNYASFCDLFVSVGFDVNLLEYYDERGQFQCRDWKPSEGMIWRSKQFDARNSLERLAYTSIIIDAIKPNI